MKIKDIITEKVSSVVYHLTETENALNILKQKRFNLTETITGSDDFKFQNNKFYFLSFSRNKINYYFKEKIDEQKLLTIFKLNGDWFNQNYKGKPVEYFNNKWIQDRKQNIDSYREMEDRIISDKPYIDLPNNLKEVITEVHVFIGKMHHEYDTGILKSVIMPLLKEAKKNNIPVYIYYNENNFFILNKKNSRNIQQLIDKIKKSSTIKKQNNKINFNYIEPWLELYYKKDIKELSGKAIEYLYKLSSDNKKLKSSIINILIQNITYSKRNADKKLHKLLSIFKKHKIHSAEEFIDILRKKWKNF